MHNDLTKNETLLLQGLADGRTGLQITVELNYSKWTTRDWMRSIVKKLEANNRTHAVAIAMRRGLIK
jgi:two-component system, NarL family, response regulator